MPDAHHEDVARAVGGVLGAVQHGRVKEQHLAVAPLAPLVPDVDPALALRHIDAEVRRETEVDLARVRKRRKGGVDQRAKLFIEKQRNSQ